MSIGSATDSRTAYLSSWLRAASAPPLHVTQIRHVHPRKLARESAGDWIGGTLERSTRFAKIRGLAIDDDVGRR